ncbi:MULTISPECIES: CsbD family protein [Planktothrix]|uniref:CsbD family protein n=1 Tax=Planktothrix mougeotii LEGE 06226 TaxID=1828728 RepID=A0ABR9UAC6_9CYAN|nr:MULTISPECIES: CsbD family protein [Planktothrix]MBD2482160.1 CsbD family protein [Planktothrix sp. FACHB-1365]MBE9143403.1 CsbD family protein [Planktothrix mougeotii LEGE 06226]
MSTEQKGKATLKNVEGKVQEAAGNITGDPEDKAEGKMKQTEAAAQHTVENVKDSVKEEIDKH